MQFGGNVFLPPGAVDSPGFYKTEGKARSSSRQAWRLVQWEPHSNVSQCLLRGEQSCDISQIPREFQKPQTYSRKQPEIYEAFPHSSHVISKLFTRTLDLRTQRLKFDILLGLPFHKICQAKRMSHSLLGAFTFFGFPNINKNIKL